MVAACHEAPPPPLVTLSRPADTVVTHWAEAPQAIWLGEQRWAVAAPSDSMVGIVDFAAGRMTPLAGSKGAELGRPFSLFTVHRDTIYVDDWARRRVTLWTLDGHLLDTLPAPDLSRGVLPRARDAAGQYYAEVPPIAGPSGAGNRDSATVLRLAPNLQKADTVTRLAPLDITQVSGENGRRFERRVFSGADQWGALPDGSVWVARVYHNRVDWYGADGKATKGDALPDRVLEVTQADRNLFVQTFPPELRPTAEQLPFAAIKPPFVAAFADPSGNVWLEKSHAITDTTREYQEVDRQGHLIRRVQYPGFGRILAVGEGHALVEEKFEGGVRVMEVVVP